MSSDGYLGTPIRRLPLYHTTMAHIEATASSTIDAPPETVYAILADYRNGHPHILPSRYFRDFEIEEGGQGKGTRIRFRIHLMGSARAVRAEVDEPEPGRVLAETDLDTGAVTTFYVSPEGNGTRVTIGTVWESGGLKGFVERLLAPRLLERIYAEELENLARLAAAQ